MNAVAHFFIIYLLASALSSSARHTPSENEEPMLSLDTCSPHISLPPSPSLSTREDKSTLPCSEYENKWVADKYPPSGPNPRQPPPATEFKENKVVTVIDKYPPSGPSPRQPPSFSEFNENKLVIVDKYPPSGPSPRQPPSFSEFNENKLVIVDKYPPSGPNPRQPPPSISEFNNINKFMTEDYPPAGPNPRHDPRPPPPSF